MQIFISWSGQTSYRAAVLIRDFIHSQFPVLKPWVSAEDIRQSARWSPDLIKIMNQITFCIICVDPSNHQSQWLSFEMGAVARSLGKSSTRIFLYEIKSNELKGPMTQYQPFKIDKHDFQRLLEDIQAHFPHIETPQDELEAQLDEEWPDFYKAISLISLGSDEESDSRDDGQDDDPDGVSLNYIDEIDEKILALLCVNEGIDDFKISTTVYQQRGITLQHLINLENMNLVWSNMSFGTRRWYITDLGRKYLPGIYQD